MIVKELPRDLYRQKIVFLYGRRQELEKWCKRKHPKARTPITFQPGSNGKYFEFQPHNGWPCTQYISQVKGEGRTKNDIIASLAHECLHCAVAIIEAKGIPIRGETDEALTYYFQWIFWHCLQYLRTS